VIGERKYRAEPTHPSAKPLSGRLREASSSPASRQRHALYHRKSQAQHGTGALSTAKLRLTLQLLLVLLAGRVVDAQGPPAELSPVQVPHGTEGRLLVLVLTEAIALRLSRLPVVDQPARRGAQNHHR